MEFHLQENLTARRNGRNFPTTVNCAAERFCMLLPKKMNIFINTVDLIINLKFSKREATLITLKPPKKVFFSRKPKWFFVLFLLEIWMILNWCFWIVVLEKTLESPLDARKSTLSIHWKDWCWNWSSNTLATWYEESTHWKRPLCWERLKAKGEGGGREWDGWIASQTQWTWIWANSETVKDREAWGAVVHEVTKSQIWLINWTTVTNV